MTKNDISHLCQFSQNFKQLRSSLDIDSGTCVDRSSCHFSDISQHLKVGENDDKNGISQLCQFSQNL